MTDHSSVIVLYHPSCTHKVRLRLLGPRVSVESWLPIGVCHRIGFQVQRQENSYDGRQDRILELLAHATACKVDTRIGL